MGKCVALLPSTSLVLLPSIAIAIAAKSVITRTISSSSSSSSCNRLVKRVRVKAGNSKSVIKMEAGGTSSSSSSSSLLSEGKRSPLAEVVGDCVKRWFLDTLKEAKTGDTAMQVLVGQMYNSGYGIPKDPQKGRAWINRASRSRSSVWKVCEKQPGYNASDSDSDDVKGDGK